MYDTTRTFFSIGRCSKTKLFFTAPPHDFGNNSLMSNTLAYDGTKTSFLVVFSLIFVDFKSGLNGINIKLLSPPEKELSRICLILDHRGFWIVAAWSTSRCSGIVIRVSIFLHPIHPVRRLLQGKHLPGIFLHTPPPGPQTPCLGGG